MKTKSLTSWLWINTATPGEVMKPSVSKLRYGKQLVADIRNRFFDIYFLLNFNRTFRGKEYGATPIGITFKVYLKKFPFRKYRY